MKPSALLKVKILILDLLSVCSMSLGGGAVVIQAFKDYQERKRVCCYHGDLCSFLQEEVLFKDFVQFMTETSNVEYLVSALAFINCLVNAPSELELRIIHRRYFETAGLLDFLECAKKIHLSGQLNTQIDIWFKEQHEDSKELEVKKREFVKIARQSPMEIMQTLERYPPVLVIY